MLFSKNLFSKKLLNYLIFRLFFKDYSFMLACFLSNEQTKVLDLLKLKLQRLNVEFQFFNSNDLISVNSNLNYLKFFQNTTFLIKIKDFSQISLLSSADFNVFAVVYKNYFLNNIYFKNLLGYFKFYGNN